MKNAKLQFDEDTTEYVSYAAAIEGKTAENYLTGLRREYNRRCRLGKVFRAEPFQKFTERELWLTVDSHESRHRLPKSYADSRNPRESTLNRLWDNMLANRAALGMAY